MKARILIADDHAVVRRGLCEAISSTPDMSVVAEAANGFDALHLARTLHVDLIILDLALPGKRGFDVLHELRANGIEVPVVLFSIFPASQYAENALLAGAQAYLSKDTEITTLINTVRKVLAGHSEQPGRGRARSGTQPFHNLSPRERLVLGGLIKGKTLRAIGQENGIHEKTVGTYRRRVLDKLGVNSNAELVSLAVLHHFDAGNGN